MRVEFQINKLSMTIFSFNEIVVGTIKESVGNLNGTYKYSDSYQAFIGSVQKLELLNETFRYGICSKRSYSDRASDKVMSIFLNAENIYDDFSKSFISLYRDSKDWRERLDWKDTEIEIVFKCDFKKSQLRQKDAMIFKEFLSKIKYFKFEFLPEDNQIKEEVTEEEN